MRYKAVVFDYGGVIANKPNINFDQDVSNILSIEINLYKEAYFIYNGDFNSNIITRTQLWEKVLKKLNRLEKLNELINYIDNLPSYIVNQEVINLINIIKKCGYKTGILTNRSLDSAEKMKKTLRNQEFDTILVSSEIGYSKSDPECYRILSEALKVNMEEIIIIDDVDHNVEIMQKIGIHPLLYIDYKTLKKQLLELLPNLTNFADIQ